MEAGNRRQPVVIVGTGYVGLVTGACLAELGATVTCIDHDRAKVAALEDGQIPIYEPGLEAIVRRHAGERLRFSSDLAAHVRQSRMMFIAVGTPQLPSGEADLSAVFGVLEEAASHLASGTAVVIKSTVPPGTAQRLSHRLSQLRPDLTVPVASNPEFLREGSAVEDFMMPDRIVVGLRDRRLEARFEQLYAPLVHSGVPLVFLSNEAAELVKYAANTYLAMRVAYVNELADLCEAAGADIGEVTGAMGLDQRIGPHYLAPGPGFGGSCFPKDTAALLAAARAMKVEFRLGEAAIAANRQRQKALFGRVARALSHKIAGRRIAILGLAFKANTDDTRDSAALPLIAALQEAGATIAAYDPVARLAGVNSCGDAYGAAESADVAVIMTEWDEFKALDLCQLARVMRTPVLVDFRNLFDLAAAAAAGLTYMSVGRATVERLAESRWAGRPNLRPYSSRQASRTDLNG